MSRRNPDRFDDDDDLPGPGKSAFPGWWIVLLCVVPVVGVVLIGGGYAWFAMRTSAERARDDQARMKVDAAANLAAHRIFTRDEVKAMIGATHDVVRAALGRPSFGDIKAPHTISIYRNKTRDVGTGVIDPETRIIFEGGVVVEVKFF